MIRREGHRRPAHGALARLEERIAVTPAQQCLLIQWHGLWVARGPGGVQVENEIRQLRDVRRVWVRYGLVARRDHSARAGGILGEEGKERRAGRDLEDEVVRERSSDGVDDGGERRLGDDVVAVGPFKHALDCCGRVARADEEGNVPRTDRTDHKGMVHHIVGVYQDGDERTLGACTARAEEVRGAVRSIGELVKRDGGDIGVFEREDIVRPVRIVFGMKVEEPWDDRDTSVEGREVR